MDSSEAQKQVLELIRTTREAKGLSRRKLAELADISPTTYNECESGARAFTFDRLTKVLEVLELDIFNFGKTVEIEQTSLQLVPVDGKQIEGYFHATAEGYKQIQERMDKMEAENKDIQSIKKDIEEIKELLRNKS
jgi:transcriptional regulator with XRE-family HTH domain